MSGKQAAAIMSRVVDLTPTLTGTEAIRRIGRSCLEHLKQNERLALDKEPEGVHQMRVSVRRIRAALIGFRNSFHDGIYEWVDGELRWLARVLGEARDLDVFDASLMGKAKDTLPAAVTRLREPIDTAREAAYATVRFTILSPRYTGLKAALEQMLNRDDIASTKLRDLVPTILSQHYDTALWRSRRFDRQNEKKRHKLRIALKKLRYVSELYGVLYESEIVAEFTTQLKQLQDDLGDANDVQAAKSIVDTFTGRKVSAAGELVIRWHERRVSRNQTRTGQHINQFFRIRQFWH